MKMTLERLERLAFDATSCLHFDNQQFVVSFSVSIKRSVILTRDTQSCKLLNSCFQLN